MELGRALSRSTRRVLVVARDARLESRVGSGLEALAPHDGVIVDNGFGHVGSRASSVGFRRVLSGLPRQTHRTVLWRNLQTLSRRDLLRLRGLLERTRRGVDCEVLTVVDGEGPGGPALLGRLESLFEPDLTITFD